MESSGKITILTNNQGKSIAKIQLDPLHLDLERTQEIARSIFVALTDEVQDPLDRAMADTWVMPTHYKYDIDDGQDMFAERAKAISTNKIENTILLRRLTLLYKV